MWFVKIEGRLQLFSPFIQDCAPGFGQRRGFVFCQTKSFADFFNEWKKIHTLVCLAPSQLQLNVCHELTHVTRHSSVTRGLLRGAEKRVGTGHKRENDCYCRVHIGDHRVISGLI